VDSSQFNYLNLEFIFLGDLPEAVQIVRSALADRRLLGFIGGASQREKATEVMAEVATVSEARDAVLYRVDANGKLREGSRVTKLVHELKNSTGADYVLVDGEEIDGPTPEEDILGEPGATNELLHGAKLKASEILMAGGFDDNQFTVWNSDSGLMVSPKYAVFPPYISRSSRPFLSLSRTGNVIMATVEAKRGRRELFGPSLTLFLDLDRQVILEPAADSPAAVRLSELDAMIRGIDEETVELIAELLSDQAQREQALQLLANPTDLAGVKKLVSLFGFDSRSVDYLTGRPIPEDHRVLRTGGLFRTLRAVMSEQEREATGISRILFRGGWSPKALMASGAVVLASGAAVHAVLANSQKFAWLPKPARGLLMLAWYADGAFYLGKGVVNTLKEQDEPSPKK